MSSLQKLLTINRGLEAWCDSEKDSEDARKIYDQFARSYYRVKVGKGSSSYGEYIIEDTNKRVKAPQCVIDICEYEHPDIIITHNGKLLVTVEITNHKPVGANVIQRFPRAVKSSKMSIPHLITMRKGDNSSSSWGVKGMLELMKIYQTPCLAILFERSHFREAFEALKNNLLGRIKVALSQGVERARDFIPEDKIIIESMNSFVEEVYEPKFRKVKVGDNCIILNIDLTGKRRYKETETGWETKGTGLFDPYPGYVLFYHYVLCEPEENTGKRKKKIFAHFRKLPRHVESQEDNPATWWIMDAEKTEGRIYWQLMKGLTDGIYFKDETPPIS